LAGLPERSTIDPYPVSKMSGDNLPENTICGVLREIYATSNDDHVKMLARVATTMAKKMSRKLYEYNKR